MTIQNKIDPDLHIICGKCGCKSMLSFSFTKDGVDHETYATPAIVI